MGEETFNAMPDPPLAGQLNMNELQQLFELAPFGITVNMVAPGWIPVERHEHDPQAMKDEYFALIPARRWGVPRDVGDAVVYLASQEASFVTGQTISVNGGMTPMG